MSGGQDETGAALEKLRKRSFERLNLTRNPFGELPRDERAALALVETGEMPRFLGGRRRALQLLADHGRGKSTLLLALHARYFPNTPYVQLHRGSPLPPKAPDQPVHFVDSIENLGWLGRRRLYARCPTLACTTHRDLRRELEGAGYTVWTHRVAIRCPVELMAILDARIDAAATGTGAPPRISPERLNDLMDAFDDDVRGIEQALYLDYQERLNQIELPPTHGQL